MLFERKHYMSTATTLEEATNAEVCSERGIHHQTVRKVQATLPKAGELEELADFFKLLGDGTRMKIVWALSLSEMCVCDMCALLEMKQPAVSHQLRKLKQGRIVESRREGKVVFYSLDDNHIRDVIGTGFHHLEELH
jgi:ArsR family transcriptional regulator, lead/cadmium/zinc/bismuth-responsive transcriptional repressor